MNSSGVLTLKIGVPRVKHLNHQLAAFYPEGKKKVRLIAACQEIATLSLKGHAVPTFVSLIFYPPQNCFKREPTPSG